MAGSLVGGLILFAWGTSYAGYLWLFGLSSLGRLLALPLLARSQSKSQPAVELAGPPVACLPRATTLDAPVLADRPDQVTDAWAHTAS